jgi:hypothetical protein
MSSGYPLPDEIALSRDEARTVLFALDEAAELVGIDSPTYARLAAAAQIIVDKFLPDLYDL